MPKHSSKPKPKPTRSNNPTSCSWCRERRRKCDGVAPSRATNEKPSRSCSLCLRAERECKWSGQQDHRLPPTYGQMEALETRIEVLQAQARGYRRILRDNGLSTDLEGGDDTTGPSYNDPLSDGEPSDTDDVTGYFGRLVIENKTTAYYGGPAPFRDLPSREEMYCVKGTLPALSSPLKINIRYSLCGCPSDVDALDTQSKSAWHQFLPSGIELNLSRLEHDLVLVKYFRYYSSWNYRVIPDLFLRDFALAISPQCNSPGSGARSPFRHYSILFHNAILAVALAYSDDARLRSRDFRSRFAQHAKSRLEEECRAPSLATVQGLGILSSYHSGLSEPGLGFMYFGISVRMGQALGLNVWVRNGAMSNQDVVERNWVSWSLFCQSPATFRTSVGAFMSAAIKGSETVILISPSPKSTLSLGGTVKLMKISSSIMDVVYCMTPGSRRSIDFKKVVELQAALIQWERALPKNLHISSKGLSACSAPPEVFMLNLAYHWLLILLLRPFFRPDTKFQSPGEPPLNGRSTRCSDPAFLRLREQAKKTCPASATLIVALFGTYRRLYTLRLSNVTAVQIAYTTGKTHFLTIVASGPNEPARARKAKEGFQECVRILREMGESWVSGSVMANILEGLLLGGEQPALQNMSALRPPLVVRVYDPPPYPPPTRSSEIPSSAPVTNLNDFRHPVGEFRAPLEPPSYLDHLDPQSNISMGDMNSPTEDYQAPSIPFPNNHTPTDHSEAFNLVAHEQQEREQPTRTGGNTSAPPGPTPMPTQNLYLWSFPGNPQSSSSFGYMWPHQISSVSASTPWAPDVQMRSVQPTFEGNLSFLRDVALQPPGMDENYHQCSDQFAPNHPGLQDPGSSTGHGWSPS
ncbi:hypothetical protein BS47DRAFT_1357025 [Hydnum rufescens UP504]|uniref:Zn(2)-C6 fungal-type domain-containing protein n=1 Tax=Hydnum rufescens UP504 TaxID=1448309 RepID=A0A9P6E2S4_9AGAM|nr:hypothetical protein BS47DRAFT_1357025 [Hydnum rufescens UP504]